MRKQASWGGMVAAIVVVLAAGALYYYGPSVPWLKRGPSRAELAKQGEAANTDALGGAATGAAAGAAGQSFDNTYQDAIYGFTFSYPSSLKVGSDESTPHVVMVQDAAQHIGFQITVSPWEGSGALTAAQVTHDLPTVNAQDFKQASVAGAAALQFTATDANFGKSTQIWLVKDGALYQISTYVNQTPLVEKVLASWQW